MQREVTLSGEAVALTREHSELLARLPATVHAFILVELRKWPLLFAPEQRYQRALLEHLAGLSATVLTSAASGITRVETEAGITRLGRQDPARLQDDAQALLRKHRLVASWRTEIDAFFQTIDPVLDARLYPADAPRRLVVQLYGEGIAVQTNSLWSRFKGTGIRIPLKLDDRRDGFLRTLFAGSVDSKSGVALFATTREGSSLGPLDSWIIESHEALHDLVSGSATPGAGPSAPRDSRQSPQLTGLSFDRLQAYRDELMRSLYNKILSGVESPQAFAAYARSLKITPASDALVHASEALQAFVRDVFLTGNGTLFVNNTFVEWAAVQALRRAQPRILVTRFGVRDKLKPFSSLLLFSQPRASDQIPLIEDPVGSFVDVEQLSYYVWLNAEKSAAYRNKTLYLFLAEGIEEMLAIRSDMAVAAKAPASSLSDVYATMAEWLKLPRTDGVGRPIGPLVS
jgi:hypothetical protein